MDWVNDSSVSSILNEAETGFVAVSTARGPHVTPERVLESDGRLWFTSSRQARKVSALRLRPRAGVLVEYDSAFVVVAGQATIIDPLDPIGMIGAPFELLRGARALTRMLVNQARDVAGYVAAGPRVPVSWLPPSRVFVSVVPDRAFIVDGQGQAGFREGGWKRPNGSLRQLVAEKPNALTEVGGEAGVQLQREGFGALALGVSGGPVLAWGRWNRASSTVRFPSAVVGCLRKRDMSAAFVVSSSAGFRPIDKTGTLLRGYARLLSVGQRWSEVALDVRTVTRWDGFDSSTIAL